MKKLLLFSIVLLTSISISAQDIVGDWHGVLEVPGAKMRLVIHISKNDIGYTTLLDSPDQGANRIPVPQTTYNDGELILDLSNLSAAYRGILNQENETFQGEFVQMGQSFPLNFSRQEIEGPKRPQHPKKPYPYHSEEVTFHNSKQDVTLAGTLTLPEKGENFPAVILITGSGPQNRDEEILNHKPFLVISDYLTRNGIAVLRYDDRGVGASTGSFSGSTTADFATDTEAAFEYLKTRTEINPEKIGLLGHSEGGMIAPIVAATHQDVGFIILLAAPGVSLGNVLLKQQELISKSMGVSDKFIALNKAINEKAYGLIAENKDSKELRKILKTYFEESLEKYPEWKEITGPNTPNNEIVEELLTVYMDPWILFSIPYNPAPTLEKVKCPVLVINGTMDLQVDADQNLPPIKEALRKGGNIHVTIKELEGLNHLFQESQTGSPMDYGNIEETFSLTVLEIIKDWIRENNF